MSDTDDNVGNDSSDDTIHLSKRLKGVKMRKRATSISTRVAVLDESKREFKNKNGWTPELELSCQKIANESAINKWLHNHNSIYLSTKLDRMTLIAGILTALTAGSGLTGFVTENYTDKFIWVGPVISLISFLLSSAATIILIIQHTYGFADKIERHRYSEGKAQWLFFNIQSQLQQPVHERQNGRVYFGWISHEFSVISNSEDIDDQIIDQFRSTFENGSIPGVDTLDCIELNTDCDYSTDTYDENQPKNKKQTADKFRNDRDASFLSIVSDVKKNSDGHQRDDGLLNFEIKRGQITN